MTYCIAFIVVFYSESFLLICAVRIYEVSEPTLSARVQSEPIRSRARGA